MRIALVVGLVVAAAAAPARAGKARPSVSEAQKAAQAWLDAMTSGDPEVTAPRARALTATPFFSYAAVDGVDPPLCPASTASEATSIRKALACLRGAMTSDGSYAEWTAKRAKPGGMARAYQKQLAAMAKAGTIVELQEECHGVFNDVIFATVKDGGTVKVEAVLSAHGACGD
jgi:hypothetical protein